MWKYTHHIGIFITFYLFRERESMSRKGGVERERKNLKQTQAQRLMQSLIS